MCGICGFNWSDDRLLARMMRVQAHRGPDDSGTYTDAAVSLGHRRLSIIDLTAHGRQPMRNEDGSLRLVFNGEIYNYVELADELRRLGHTLASRTDTEVILHAYEQWGEACLQRLNGQFAFGLYDARRRRCFLARDRFGIKPLYYWRSGGRFAFASEIKALLEHPAVPRRPDDQIIYDYLAFNRANDGRRTFFEGVHALLPGEYAMVDLASGAVRRRRWYRIRPGPTRAGLDGPETVERFRALFLDAVRLRLTRADVEVGSCLSGGLDSSSIVCSLDRLQAGRARGHQTFSIVFPGTPLDESPYVREVVGRTGVRSHVTTTGAGSLLEQIDRLTTVQDEPFASATVFAQWEVMRLARRHGIKVLLDGQGGDELLGGYLFLAGYRLLDQLVGGRPWAAMAETAGFLRLHGLQLDPFLLAVGVCVPRWLRTPLSRRYLRVPLETEFAARHAARSRVPEDLYCRMSFAEALAQRTTIGLQQLLRAEDRNAMAFSIEARLPFLDHRLVEFLFTLDGHWKIRRGLTKYVLREAMRGILPEAVRHRMGKLGFPTPFAAWLREPAVRRYVESVLGSASFRGRGYLDAERLQRLYARHLAGKDASQTLWKALNLELWFRRFID